MKVLRAGVYRHYKGHRYLVLGLAEDSTNDGEGRQVVVYVGLENGDREQLGPPLRVRALDEFFEYVCGDEACAGYGRRGCPMTEHVVQRFTYDSLNWGRS